MPTLTYHVSRIHTHVKKHHKKYLAGIFGGYAVIKLVLLVMGLTVVQHSLGTKAQLDTGCVLTGQYYTGAIETGCTRVPEQLTGGYMTGCTTIPGYWTGGSLNESGELVDQVWVDETQVGCTLTGQTTIPGYMTGCTTEGGYRTGGTVICESPDVPGDQPPVDLEPDLNSSLNNGICETADIVWQTPLSGAVVKGEFPITWVYSGDDCTAAGLSLYILDHNQQWISLNPTIVPTLIQTLSSPVATSGGFYQFNSLPFVQYQNSGLYHVLGTSISGHSYFVYTGMYSGAYTNFYTGYALKLVNTQEDTLYQVTPFTIDNKIPTLSSYTLVTDTSATGGYVNEDATLTFTFTGSETLTGITITLGTKSPSTSLVSDVMYTYTWELTSSYPEGNLPLVLSYADLAGNTGSLVYTSSLIFDTTTPIVSGLVFSESGGKIYLNYTGSEPTKYMLSYQKKNSDDNTIATGSEYLTAQKLLFGTLDANTLYTFTLKLFDRAGNMRKSTGDVMWTNTGTLVTHYRFVYTDDEDDLNANLFQLARILKAEIEKFNECKEALTFNDVDVKVRNTTYTLQMPEFTKTQMKKIVNAFTLFVIDEVKNSSMTKTDIQEITNKFDNFLVVLKLLRDDDNSCQQNLSNYHIRQFKKVLEKHDINID